MTTLRDINCAEATDRAAFFVLGALDAREMLEVREHLEVCSRPHEEFREIGGVVGHLAELPDEVEPEPSLRQRVLEAVDADVRARRKEGDAAERLVAWFENRSRTLDEDRPDAGARAERVPVGPGLPDVSTESSFAAPGEERTPVSEPFPRGALATEDVPLPSEPEDAIEIDTRGSGLEPSAADAAAIEPIPIDNPASDAPPASPERISEPERTAAPLPTAARRRRRGPIRAWLLAAAALIALAALVAWNVLLQLQAAEERQHLQALRDALAARNTPNAVVAVLAGTDRTPGASGTAVMTPGKPGYLVVSGLPPAPAGMTYQAWYVNGSESRSAGTFRISSDGMGVLTGLDPGQQSEAMAVTLEPEDGVERATQPPLLYGRMGR